jgi:serine/threonine protein kinase
MDFAALQPGQVFASRYRVERLLKSGGMGAVYVVRHVRTNATFALKVMRPEIVREHAMRERFAQEAQVSSLIESSHVVAVTDADIDEASGMPFLVMELLRGKELGDVLRERGRLPFEEVVEYLRQAARALDKAHAQRIVHRDLKPENLFLVISDEGPPRIKVLDFGIAKIIQAATSAASTQGGGTPLYMAPEQTRKSRDIGPWTDVWALGLIAYALLVGRPYWEAETIGELYGELLSPDREPPSARAARSGVNLPGGFDAWFARAVNNEPKQRYPSAGEAVAALAACLSVSQQTVAYAPPTPSVSLPGATLPMTTTAPFTEAPSIRETKHARRVPVVPLVVLGAAVVGGAVFALIRTSDPKPVDGPPAPAPSSAKPAASIKPVELSLAQKIEETNPFVSLGNGTSLQRHEVTRSEYAAWIVSLRPEDRLGARPLRDWLGEPIEPTTAKKPVTWVTHARATRFCKAIDARLPANADWSAALPGKTYPWGTAWPPPGPVSIEASSEALADVESASGDRTASSIADLFGNAREWLADADGGFAAIRGASIAMKKADAVSAFSTVAHKEAAEGGDPIAHASELAAQNLGFRCAR